MERFSKAEIYVKFYHSCAPFDACLTCAGYSQCNDAILTSSVDSIGNLLSSPQCALAGEQGKYFVLYIIVIYLPPTLFFTLN